MVVERFPKYLQTLFESTFSIDFDDAQKIGRLNVLGFNDLKA